ncbi:unnamed protein product [Ilex paraguariensis]|uniref:Uncharacterized protein n=1 Tax=Ilex paraguariensis TaxID=185542 RepID=A0ABC8T2M9_9AQUA
MPLCKVIERLDAEKSLTESAPTPTLTYCQRNKSDNDIFVSNLRHHLQELIHSPMEEHKACLKSTFQKIMGKFSERTTIPTEGEKSLPLETTAKN